MKRIILAGLLITLLLLTSCKEGLVEEPLGSEPIVTEPLNQKIVDKEPQLLVLEETPIGKVTYEKSDASYYILKETEGIFSEIMNQDLRPFVDEEHFSNIYENNAQIEKLLTNIDPNYKDNFNHELSDEEIWTIVNTWFDWIKKHNAQNDVHPDLVSQAEYYGDSGKINMGACVHASNTNYIMLLRLGIPRNRIAVANIVAGSTTTSIVDGAKVSGPYVINSDVDKLISQGRIRDASELPNFIANSGGHYYVIINIGSKWYHLERSCFSNYWDEVQPGKYACFAKYYAYPHRIYIAPKKENCENQFEVGCQDAPLGVPLLTEEVSSR